VSPRPQPQAQRTPKQPRGLLAADTHSHRPRYDRRWRQERFARYRRWAAMLCHYRLGQGALRRIFSKLLHRNNRAWAWRCWW
jgi:hypothetical protein